MCSIAGIVSRNSTPVSTGALESMIATIGHRGPDGMGIHTEPQFGLAHARLSIIDLTCGTQPMTNRDRSLWITFNGEIFNYLELREALVEKGHLFSTRSDTEVILHTYEEYGDDCVRHFNGQWAFAVWDTRRQRLLLSRDRLGVRPLFYALTPETLLFASEIKALFAHPGITAQLDPRALDQLFTFLNILPPRTIFKDVYELSPGHSMTLHLGRLDTHPHWKLDLSAVPRSRHDRRSEEDYAEELLALLTDATRLRLRSDVPVAAYLSGGLDSSVITALMTALASAPPKTFSVAFEDQEFDESPFQREVARFIGSEHHELRCSYRDIGEVFPEVVWHAEKPLLWTAPGPLYLLSRSVRRSGLKVVLTGEGSDEILGGYDIFKETKIRRFCAAQPESRLRPLLLTKAYPYLHHQQAQSLGYLGAVLQVNSWPLSDPLFSHLPRWHVLSPVKPLLFSRLVRAELSNYDPLADLSARLPASFADWDWLAQAQYLEAMHNLSGYLLSSQGDRVAMAHGVEGRFPFLDYRVVEFAATVPSHMKLRVLNEKRVLKRATRHLVPARITDRRKQPYRAPLARSFFSERSQLPLHDYVHDLLRPDRVIRDGVFEPSAVQKLAEKVRTGRAISIRDNWAFVGVLSTQLLVDQFVNRSRGRTAHATA